MVLIRRLTRPGCARSAVTIDQPLMATMRERFYEILPEHICAKRNQKYRNTATPQKAVKVEVS